MTDNRLINDLSLDDQRSLNPALRSLTRQFHGTFDDESIEHFLVDSYERLAASSRNPTFLSVFAERFARERMQAMARVDATTTKPGVLFLCVHNAGRSQMAAALLSRDAKDKVVVHSAGSAPGETLNQAVVTAMAEVGIDISRERPRKLTEAMVEDADVIVTMGCGDACPVVPGKRYLDWDLPDPAGKSIEDVRPIRDEISARIEALLTELLRP
jgi:protein-tyrosine-phosphatase